MFGRGWEPAQATIVALKEVWSWGYTQDTNRRVKTYEYVADVQPSSEAPMFRTVMEEPFDERVWSQPAVGDVVLAICNPKHQKAKFDTKTLAARAKAQEEARKKEEAQRFDEMVNAPPGSDASPAGGDPEQLESGPSSNPKVDILRLSIRQARRRGDEAEVERLTAMLAQLE